MSRSDLYFTAPLALLRGGSGVLDALESCVSCGIVNAGIGWRKTHGERAFKTLLAGVAAEARSRHLPIDGPPSVRPFFMQAALAGSHILGVQDGACARHAALYQAQLQPRAVYFRMRADWVWNALHTARQTAGVEDPGVRKFKPLTWREFRILAAILSAKVNTYDFTFLGWESIQARACGYHTKALFQAGKDTLPPHCQPLSRRQIRQGLDRLEVLGFFARCRYAKGARGGLMAYSFRHPKRQGLVEAIKEWAAANRSFKQKVDNLRAADRAAFAS